MSRTYTAMIARYDNKRGMCGKLRGLITFSDGKSVKVWESKPGEPDLHAQCIQLAAFPPHDVRYEFWPSPKWGASLTKIESTKSDWELADLVRQQQESALVGQSAPGKYVREMISKGTQRQVDAIRNGDHDELMGRVG